MMISDVIAHLNRHFAENGDVPVVLVGFDFDKVDICLEQGMLDDNMQKVYPEHDVCVEITEEV